MTLIDLQNSCNIISNKIKNWGEKNNSHYVIDGIIDPEKYLNSKFKILWILKEANSESDTWSYLEKFKDIGWLLWCGKSVPTLKRIIYTTYGILRDSEWQEIPDAKNEKSFEPLQEIAIMNIKKIPGSSTANYNEIQNAYNENYELLKEQVDTFNPNVIIFGNTLQYFKESDFEELNFSDKQISEFGNHFYQTKNKLYIHTWHPAVRGSGFTDYGYVMDLVEIVRNWEKNR